MRQDGRRHTKNDSWIRTLRSERDLQSGRTIMKSNKEPFFAGFLESQLDKVTGGGPQSPDLQTRKAPSDQEENFDNFNGCSTQSPEMQTKKFPSDQEDGFD